MAKAKAPLAPDPPRADALVSRGIKKSTSDHVIAHFGPGAHHHLNTSVQPIPRRPR